VTSPPRTAHPRRVRDALPRRNRGLTIPSDDQPTWGQSPRSLAQPTSHTRRPQRGGSRRQADDTRRGGHGSGRVIRATGCGDRADGLDAQLTHLRLAPPLDAMQSYDARQRRPFHNATRRSPSCRGSRAPGTAGRAENAAACAPGSPTSAGMSHGRVAVIFQSALSPPRGHRWVCASITRFPGGARRWPNCGVASVRRGSSTSSHLFALRQQSLRTTANAALGSGEVISSVPQLHPWDSQLIGPGCVERSVKARVGGDSRSARACCAQRMR
jgi:hypothetical protein